MIQCIRNNKYPMSKKSATRYSFTWYFQAIEYQSRILMEMGYISFYAFDIDSARQFYA